MSENPHHPLLPDPGPKPEPEEKPSHQRSGYKSVTDMFDDRQPGTLRVLTTGILAILPQLESWLILTVGGRGRRSITDPTRVIPEHFAWILAEKKDIAKESREADFAIEKDRFSLFILDRERLELRTSLTHASADPHAVGRALIDDKDVIQLSHVCCHARVARINGQVPPGPHVRAQIHLPMVPLQQMLPTEMEFTFVPQCDGVPTLPAKKVTHVGNIDIRIDAKPFAFQPHSFDNIPLQPIRFKGDGNGVVIALGNTPIGDSQKWIRRSGHGGGHHHEGADPHFELYYDLVAPLDHPPCVPYGRLPKQGPQEGARPAVPMVGNCDHVLAEWAD